MQIFYYNSAKGTRYVAAESHDDIEEADLELQAGPAIPICYPITDLDVRRLANSFNLCSGMGVETADPGQKESWTIAYNTWISHQHPRPWRVEYSRRCEEWDERSCPYIVDKLGVKVIEMPQFTNHPGVYDQQADTLAHRICVSVNRTDF